MTAAVPILWMTLSAAAVLPPKDEGATPSRHIEIVLVGPQPDRRDMQVAIQAVAGTEVELSWSALDTFPGDGRLAQPDRGGVVHIWIDVTDSSRVRVVSPASSPAASPVIRTVEMPAAGEDQQPIIREAVAQIVSATVWALRDAPAARPYRVAFTPPPPLASGSSDADVSQPGRMPGRMDGPGDGLYSLAIFAGAHTSPFSLSATSGPSNGLGLSLGLSLRRETPRWLLEARAMAERSDSSLYVGGLESQLYSATLAVARRFTAGPLTFSLGLQLGALFLRQTSTAIPIDGVINNYSPETNWAVGLLGGAVGEASLALSRRWYLHLVAGVPLVITKVVDISDGDETGWQLGWYTQLLGGVGAYL